MLRLEESGVKQQYHDPNQTPILLLWISLNFNWKEFYRKQFGHFTIPHTRLGCVHIYYLLLIGLASPCLNLVQHGLLVL